MRHTCGHPCTHRDAPFVTQNSVDINQILKTRLKLFNSCSSFVSRHSELLEKTARNCGHICDEVLCDQHLIVPGQANSLTGDLPNS